MSLIPEKSINSWAEKLACEHNEPFREVLHIIALAVINKELPAFCLDYPVDWSNPGFPSPNEPGLIVRFACLVLPKINHPGVFEFSYLGIGNDNPDTSPPIKEYLDDIMIKAADMERWLRSRGAVIDEHSRETGGPGIESKGEAFKNWLSKTYPSSIPAGQTGKTLKRAFKQETGIDISTTQLWRVIKRT
jgi:hypothetical protein